MEHITRGVATSTVRRSRLVSAGRRVARVMQHTLPSQTYAVAMGAMLDGWRFAQRMLYYRHELAAAWRGDAEQRARAACVHRVMSRSLVGAAGLEATFDAVRDVQRRGVPGCLVELGVARGGCAALMRVAADLGGQARHLWLFDSYEGLPDPTRDDLEADGSTGSHIRPLPKGACLGTYDDVESYLFGEMRFSRSDITMVKGWFDVTVRATRSALGPIAVLRIDADWYESVKTCLDGLYDQVSPAGTIIIDDYGTCHGARRAVDEFQRTRAIAPAMAFDGRGGCLWRKDARTRDLALV